MTARAIALLGAVLVASVSTVWGSGPQAIVVAQDGSGDHRTIQAARSDSGDRSETATAADAVTARAATDHSPLAAAHTTASSASP